ncbi:MAG: 23S rRNA (guanosine(2251)-2'-O)-methyltransferase RlmB [Formosimonas sp.]
MSHQLLFGFHAVQARLRVAANSIREVYVENARHDKRMQHFLAALARLNIEPRLVDKHRLDGLVGHSRHQGVAALASAVRLAANVDEVLESLTVPPLLLILDGVTDPHNLGACLRVADAAGVHAVIAPKDKAVGLNATVAKVASGAAEHVPYIMVTNLARTMREIKEYDIWVVGTDEEGTTPLHQGQFGGAMAWVMGAEGEGMRRLTRETCDELVSIPMAGSVASLNVSVAAGVCLFESVRQRGALVK